MLFSEFHSESLFREIFTKNPFLFLNFLAVILLIILLNVFILKSFYGSGTHWTHSISPVIPIWQSFFVYFMLIFNRHSSYCKNTIYASF